MVTGGTEEMFPDVDAKMKGNKFEPSKKKKSKPVKLAKKDSKKVKQHHKK